MQADEVLEHRQGQLLARLHGGQPETREQGAALGAVERDLQRGAARRRLVREQVRDRDVERLGELLEERQPRLAAPVLDHRQQAGRGAHGLPERVEGEAARRAEVPDAPAERDEVRLGRGLSLGTVPERLDDVVLAMA